jgi:hypothetical protein
VRASRAHVLLSCRGQEGSRAGVTPLLSHSQDRDFTHAHKAVVRVPPLHHTLPFARCESFMIRASSASSSAGSSAGSSADSPADLRVASAASSAAGSAGSAAGSPLARPPHPQLQLQTKKLSSVRTGMWWPRPAAAGAAPGLLPLREAQINRCVRDAIGQLAVVATEDAAPRDLRQDRRLRHPLPRAPLDLRCCSACCSLLSLCGRGVGFS